MVNKKYGFDKWSINGIHKKDGFGKWSINQIHNISKQQLLQI